MNNKLNDLYATLNKLGSQNAADEINLLISELKTASSGIISKADWQTSLYGESPIGSAASPNAEAWQRIIDDYDKPAYRVEAFHTIVEGIAAAVITPIVGKINQVKQTHGVNPTEADREQTLSTLQSTAHHSIHSIGGLSKIASASSYSMAFNQNIEDSIDRMINNLPAKYATADDISYLKNELSIIKSSSPASATKAVGRTGGFFSRALPVIGLAISLPLAIKNLIEAWNNGVAIFTELPLQKYGISKAAIATGPAGLPFLVGQLKSAIEENEENPENLYELLTICKTLAAFWLDVVFAMTNGIMAVIDAITVAAMILPLDGPVLDIATGLIGTVLTFGLIGLEWGSEWLSHKFWENIKGRIKEIAEEKLQEGVAPSEPPIEAAPSVVTTTAPVEQQSWESSLFGASPVPA
jgi:hypothetical protein